ncbi:hypothetical protein B7P43_G05813 [Cryptotermes secundus]|uniref:Endonuclease/exonuclease/phosphatase domain-containing protein n=1 Tax=Cryptotermes secundus TaxID=105785 RepID=A0A2J7PUP1_9NEOP|nr:hypothetical protein B7P43_G05813 [Cryptotermes secundus]
MKILLGDFNAKVGREDILKQTIWNGSIHEISNDNGVRVVNFATPKNLTIESTVDLHRGINDFKRVYQPRSNLVKDENGDLLAESHNSLNRWRNYFSQLLNVHRVSTVRQTEIHTAEPLVPDPSPFGVEIAIAKLKRYKSPGSDMPDQWKESIILPVHKKGDKTDCSNYRGISLLSTSYKILSNILLSRFATCN